MNDGNMTKHISVISAKQKTISQQLSLVTYVFTSDYSTVVLKD